MRRRLFNLAAAVSLALLVLTATLWVRSFRVADQVMVRGAGDSRWIASDRGTILLFHRSRVPDEDERTWMVSQARPGQFQILLVRSSSDFGWLQFRAVGWHRVPVSVASPAPSQTQTGRTVTVVLLSHWVLCMLATVLPACWLTRHLRARTRVRLGRCPSCGYDLRATPDRCPECGQPSAGGTGDAADR